MVGFKINTLECSKQTNVKALRRYNESLRNPMMVCAVLLNSIEEGA